VILLGGANSARVEVGSIEDDELDDEPHAGRIVLVGTADGPPNWIVNGAELIWSGAKVAGNTAAPTMTLRVTDASRPGQFDFGLAPDDV